MSTFNVLLNIYGEKKQIIYSKAQTFLQIVPVVPFES